MIARLWRGWTRPQDGDVYALFLRSTVFPSVAGSVPGFRGAYVLRREDGSEDEFLVLTVFESLEAVRAFAGDEYAVPVIEPEAARLITRGDDLATHYEIVGHATPPLEARD